MDLRDLYLQTLARCAPEVLIAKTYDPSMPRGVVAIGKCAGAMLDGIADYDDAFVAIPESYRAPKNNAEVHRGGHPGYTRASFEAGRALLAFVEQHDDLTFLISGGGSACVEVPRAPFTEEELIETNEKLVKSGLPIREINVVRKQLSALKGGRLGKRVRGRLVTLLYSDVSRDRLADVASGPTLTNDSSRDEAIAVLERLDGCDRIVTKLRDVEDDRPVIDGTVLLVADNDSLLDTAAALIGPRAVRLGEALECDVADAARRLAANARELRPGQILVAGGEPTVVRRGDGRGGRDIELAVRFALEMEGVADIRALFGSSDGVDGNSGAAGLLLPHVRGPFDRPRIEAALARSASFAICAQVGEPIMIAPTGNNLRDLFLVARD